MNQIVERAERPAKAALVAGGAVAAIVPQSIEECFRLSEAISQSGMAPYGLDTPQKVMIAMMSGLELGMPPMMAVQSIAVINNRPCMWGDALIGVVRSGTVCTYVKEWIEGDGDARIAYCETLRKGETAPVCRQFSVDDAKRAGLWQTQARVTKQGKNGSSYEKDNDSPWYRYPQRMLQMRARAWCLRDVYPDILKGMQVREEVEDYQHVGPDSAKDVTPKPSVMDRLRANAQNAPESPASEREGFTASPVQRQAARVLEGDVMPEGKPYDADTGELSPEDSPSGASPPASEPGNASPSQEVLPEPAGELPHSASAGSSNSEPDMFGKFAYEGDDLKNLREFAEKGIKEIRRNKPDDPKTIQFIEMMFPGYARELVTADAVKALNGIKRALELVIAGDRNVDRIEAWFETEFFQEV